MVHDLAELLSDDGPRVHSEAAMAAAGLMKVIFASVVDPEDAFAGRLEDQRGLRERPLVEPPGDDAAHTGPEHEERVDAAPTSTAR
mgnify:CR=1 FL=1